MFVDISFMPRGLCGSHYPSQVEISLLYASSRYYVRSEVFTAVPVNNALFFDIKIQFVPHRRHTTSPLQSLAG
jgi:hypothetical protein